MSEFEITFKSNQLKISGTLTKPDSHHNLPGVLLIPGSGRIDRNENHRLMRLNIFNEIANFLSHLQIASLRYDKRGVGKSEGDFYTTSFQDNIDDAMFAFEFLSEQPIINRQKVFLIGHSEGAMIATHLASRISNLAGVVLLAGPVTNCEELLKWQLQEILKGISGWRKYLQKMICKNPATTQQKFIDKIKHSTQPIMRIMLCKKINAAWFREILNQELLSVFPNIAAPILAITGKKDIQVPYTDLEKMQQVAKSAIEIHAPDHLTHILRSDLNSPSILHYRQLLRKPIDPEIMTLIASWLNNVIHNKPLQT